jgi:phasin family protein
MPSYSPSPAMRSGMQAQVSFLTELASRTYDSLRKLSELNLHFAQQVVNDTAEATQQMVSCRDPFQFASVAARAAQPAMQHLQSYQQQLAGMLTGAQVDFTRSAEAMMPDNARYAAAAMLQGMTRETASSSDAFSAASHDPSPQAATPHAGDSGASHHTPG